MSPTKCNPLMFMIQLLMLRSDIAAECTIITAYINAVAKMGMFVKYLTIFTPRFELVLYTVG
jgi:hypothetical protein